MLLPLLATAAMAGPRFHTPNSLIGVSGGIPSVVSLRGEAWMTEGATFEVGVGAPLPLLNAWLDGTAGRGEPAVFDGALRWRPRFLCVGCGQRVLGTFGVGLGGLVTPAPELLGPWRWAVGPDVAATLVAWSTPEVGWQLSARVGGGPEFVGNRFREPQPALWAFGTVGMAF